MMHQDRIMASPNIASLFAITCCILSILFPIATRAAETFILDTQHSYILWRINHLGFSTQSGKWYASGTLTLDKDKPQNSRVNATVQIKDLVTGNSTLDEHLKAKLFFDAEQFPTATFVSDRVEVKRKSMAKVRGILTIRGIAKPVTFDVKLNQIDMNPMSDKMTAGFSGTTKIKRSDFGITTLLPGLSDEVELDIEVEAYQAKE